MTAPYLASFLNSLSGSNTVAAHSLGNMVALSALSTYSANIQNYLMLDAAVSTEAIDGTTSGNLNMVDSQWVPYQPRLYAANWANLFTNLDYRSTLTWSGRLTNFGNAQVYNFYSTGEEVLREFYGDAPTNILGAVVQIGVDFLLNQDPPSSFVWVWEEKAKGLSFNDHFLGSTHGGWRFNTNYNVGTNRLAPAQAALLPGPQLQTNAFFDFGSPAFSADLALEGPLGDAYAFTYRWRILADAIPATSWPIGSHPIPRLSPPRSPQERNFDMDKQMKNGWPLTRSSTEQLRWHHSDFKEVAYTYTHILFDSFVSRGNLK